ncbi:MAG: hypothetical protein AAB588_04490 [Patescibacteria group bacterium]
MNKKYAAGFLLTSFLVLQASTAFAIVAAAPEPSAFELAWDHAAGVSAYTFSCVTSTSSVKVEKDKIKPDKLDVAELTLKAIKHYKTTEQISVSGKENRLALSQKKLNTLGIIDSLVAGKLTFEQAVTAMQKVVKINSSLIVDNNTFYMRFPDGKWKMAEGSKSTESSGFDAFLKGQPLVLAFKKGSFTLAETTPGSSKKSFYQGELSGQATVSLLKPFMGVQEALSYPETPVKLYLDKNGHFKKFDATATVKLEGLSFKVKNNCTFNFQSPKIKLPVAETVDLNSILQQLVQMLQ